MKAGSFMSSSMKSASSVRSGRRTRRFVSRIFIGGGAPSVSLLVASFGDGLGASIVRIASVSIAARKLSQEKKKIDELEIITDPEEAAKGAGLRYVSDENPGYTRERRGKKFVYFDTDGKEIRDEARILRLNRLAIPPAYTGV